MKTRQLARGRRHRRVRKKVRGTPDRPRLVVFRSHRHIYAQIVDDLEGQTLASASSVEADLREGGNDVERAGKVGQLIADRAKEKGIATVVFDRGGYRFHGKVKALAQGAREKGLEF